jgi:hypothetical protein
MMLSSISARDFEATDAVIDEFRQSLDREKVELSDQELQANLDFIKKRIRLQLVAVIYGEADASHLSVENDYLVQKALANLPQARELLAKAKKYMASKGTK